MTRTLLKWVGRLLVMVVVLALIGAGVVYAASERRLRQTFDTTVDSVPVPSDTASVAVTFNTTAPTPEPGTPPRPNTDTSNCPPAATAVNGATRVSTNRDGTNDVNDELAANQPTTSTNTFTGPIADESFEFQNDTLPSAPTLATTEFATG